MRNLTVQALEKYLSTLISEKTGENANCQCHGYGTCKCQWKGKFIDLCVDVEPKVPESVFELQLFCPECGHIVTIIKSPQQ
ncbi:MAG: hypothetical protein HYW69_02650 [Candidatus Nealsonbacteria bacterium]|nr:hypothetical protein [Candidatus Nealsonbacteria bacterium]